MKQSNKEADSFSRKLGILQNRRYQSDVVLQEARIHNDLELIHGSNAQFNYAQFCSVLGISDSSFARSLFDTIADDTDKDLDTIAGDKVCISIQDLAGILANLQQASRFERFELFFNAFDTNSDGEIDEDELKKLLASACSDNSVQIGEEEVEKLAQCMINTCSCSNNKPPGSKNKRITLSDFMKLIEYHPRFLQAFKIEGIVESHRKSRKTDIIKYIVLHIKAYWFGTILFGIILCLLMAPVCYAILHPVVQNQRLFNFHRIPIVIAGICAAFILVAAACVLFPVNRLVTDILRETIFGSFLNFELAYTIHAALGWVILIAGLIHSIAWFFIFGAMANTSGWVNNDPEYATVSTYGASERSMFGLCTSEVAITGYIMLGVFLFTIIPFYFKYPGSFECIRKTRLGSLLNDFDAFMWSHRIMAWGFFIALILHPLPGLPNASLNKGSVAWIFVSIPIILYLMDLILTIRRYRYQAISNVTTYRMLKGNVLHLVLSRPRTGRLYRGSFRFKAGQWVRLCIPDVSKTEWHPFTISSASFDPELSFHIRAVGDWTSAVHKMFNNLPLSPPFPLAYVDGPYGAPCQDYSRFPIAICVANGIGATPMVSILREVACMGCPEKSTRSQERRWPHTMYFHWIVREQDSAPAWFDSSLKELLAADSEVQVHINMWFTGGGSKQNLRNLIKLLVQDIAEEEMDVDVVCGLSSDRLSVHFGRPDWESEFDTIAYKHSEESAIGVFCCGSALLQKDLEKICMVFREKTRIKFRLKAERF